MIKVEYAEALNKMSKGYKVRNIYFSADEWLQMVDGIIKDEQGCFMGSWNEKFWSVNMKKLPSGHWYVIEDQDWCTSCGKSIKSAGSNLCLFCIGGDN